MASKNGKRRVHDKGAKKRRVPKAEKMPKRIGGDAVKNALGKHKLAVALILLVVAGFVVSFVAYGLAYGGNVSFTFGVSNEIRQSYQLVAMSEFRNMPSTIDITHILIENTGNSGVTVIVTMHAVNAVVSSGYYGPYGDSTNVQMYLPSGSGERVVNFYLTLPLQVSSFTIRVSVGKVVDFSSISALATSSLSSIQPTAPTTLVYSRESPNPIIYQLTQQY
jgi:hypothetical protein